MLKRFAYSFLFLLTISFSSISLFAGCPCAHPAAFEAALEQSNVVFTGRVAGMQPNWISGGMKVTFETEQSWKRSIEPYFSLNTPDPKLCGIPFETGARYLVFVTKGFSFQTDSCLPTKQLSEAGEEVQKLGAGMKPGTNPALMRWMWIMGLTVLAGMLFLAFVVARKKIRPKA